MEQIKVTIGERKYIIDNTVELATIIETLERIKHEELMKALRERKQCATD